LSSGNRFAMKPMSQTMETFQQVLDQTQYGSANPILQANL